MLKYYNIYLLNLRYMILLSYVCGTCMKQLKKLLCISSGNVYQLHMQSFYFNKVRIDYNIIIWTVFVVLILSITRTALVTIFTVVKGNIAIGNDKFCFAFDACARFWFRRIGRWRFIGSPSMVFVYMDVKIALLCERFFTIAALVRLFSCKQKKK
jgi:hypothetical protein